MALSCKTPYYVENQLLFMIVKDTEVIEYDFLPTSPRIRHPRLAPFENLESCRDDVSNQHLPFHVGGA